MTPRQAPEGTFSKSRRGCPPAPAAKSSTKQALVSHGVDPSGKGQDSSCPGWQQCVQEEKREQLPDAVQLRLLLRGFTAAVMPKVSSVLRTYWLFDHPSWHSSVGETMHTPYVAAQSSPK
tara:strand:+ start:12 stop:371 length:360 start_codon:yes stop_codon:yes gene_type:complete